MDRLGLRILHYNSPGQSSWCSTTGVPPVPTHQCGPNYPVLLLLVLVAAGTAPTCKRWFLASGGEGGVRSEMRKVRKMSKMMRQERQKAPTTVSIHTTIAKGYFLKEWQIPPRVTLSVWRMEYVNNNSHFHMVTPHSFTLFILSHFYPFILSHWHWLNVYSSIHVVAVTVLPVLELTRYHWYLWSVIQEG